MTRASRYWVTPRLMIIAAMAYAAGGLAVAAPSDSATDSAELDEIVVRATRMDKRINEIPAAISVVTKDDIQRGSQQLALDESLAGVPGVFIQDRYNFSRDLRIAIRGFGARSSFGIRGVKIIVDGIPESLPDGQGQSDAIDLGSTQQIEVIRGPSSSLYGNASGGVINVTSERGPAIPFVETRLSVGAFDFNQMQLKVGGESGRLNYLVNISKMEFDGYRAHSEAENTLLNGRFTFAIDDESELGIVLNATDQPVAKDPGGIDLAQAQADPTSARQRNVDFDTGEVLEQQRFGLTYKKSFGERHEIRLRNHYVLRDFANLLPFIGGGATQFERFFVGGGASYAFYGDMWDRPNSLIVGLDVDRQDDDRQRYDNNMGVLGPLIADQDELVTNIGLFLQNEIALADDFALTLGLRYDEIEYEVDDKFLSDGNDSAKRTLDELSPMVAVLYSPVESTSFYATISTAFEGPITVELTNPSGTGGFNPNIEPQLATNYEVGVKGSLGQRNAYELALFTIDVEDELIPFDLGGRDIYENAGESSREGIEFAFMSEPIDGLSLRLAYTYSDFQFDKFVADNGDDYSGNAIPGIPDNMLRGEVAYTHSSGFYGVIDARNVGEFYADNANTVEIDSYTVVNLRAGVADWQVGNWVLEPFFGINNLTDESYSAEIRINAFGGRYYEPAPDRHLYGGLSIRYNFGIGEQ
ncbi:MAG: TonB-dependent receptor [Gammaproteobacteria bacterium]|nr:TonB-dependent receptor [Gammaproteobacteria bacterium]